jgi:hypothetical protein
VPFAYYNNLPPEEQRVYRRSDGIPAIRLEEPHTLWPYVDAVREALATGVHRPTETSTAQLCRALTERLGVPPLKVEVLSMRPHDTTGELHGLYTYEPGKRPRLQVWMRTAKQARVVAFKTYLRTVLHEVCHHLDFALLGLPHSFHTQGFFQRESSLFHQLVPEARASRAAPPAP